jgi:ketosteroid isomerase-like protein
MAHAELVKSAWDAFNRRDVAAALAVAHPEIELHDLAELPDAETFRGHDGVRKLLALNYEPWEFVTTEIEQLIEVGDDILALMRNRARGRGSGVEIVQPRAALVGFRDDLIVRVRFFADHTDALEAVGLTQHESS